MCKFSSQFCNFLKLFLKGICINFIRQASTLMLVNKGFVITVYVYVYVNYISFHKLLDVPRFKFMFKYEGNSSRGDDSILSSNSFQTSIRWCMEMTHEWYKDH